MANNAAYVSAGKPNVSGAIYRAAKGTTLPTASGSQLSADFKAIGYISADGVKNNNSPSTDKVSAWGGDAVLYTQGDKEDTFKFTMMETMNVEVLKAVYGSKNVTGELGNGLTVDATSDDAEEAVWVIDMILKGDVAKRIVIPCGKITELDEISYADTDAIGYGVTVSAIPYDGRKTHIEYIGA